MQANKKEIAAAKTRQKLIDTTITLIGEQGYHGLTSSKLIKGAGVSKGALYHHYTSLDELIYEALQVMLVEMMEEMDPTQFDSFEAYLALFGDYMFGHMFKDEVKTKAFYSFLQVALFDTKIKLKLREFAEFSFAAFAKSIEHFYQGKLEKAEVTAMIRVLDAYFIGIGFHWFLFDGDKKCRESWDFFSRMLLAQLNKPLGE